MPGPSLDSDDEYQREYDEEPEVFHYLDLPAEMAGLSIDDGFDDAQQTVYDPIDLEVGVEYSLHDRRVREAFALETEYMYPCAYNGDHLTVQVGQDIIELYGTVTCEILSNRARWIRIKHDKLEFESAGIPEHIMLDRSPVVGYDITYLP